LQKVARDAEFGRRRVDKLVTVWRNNGSEAWVLIHVEVQSQREGKFAERMYVYNYRLFDRYRRKVARYLLNISGRSRRVCNPTLLLPGYKPGKSKVSPGY
jgi:hypothetical protein